MDIPKLELIWQYLDYWAEIDPDFPSIRFGKKTITAKELNDKTDQLAKAFLDMGVKKGDTVVTVLATIPEFIYSFFAASKIGAITIPMDKEYKKADFKLLIPHSSPKVVVPMDKWQKNLIADNLQELSPEFGNVKYIMVGKHKFGVPLEQLMAKKYHFEEELKAAEENQDADDCTLVIWTGGTTGAPKAVEITHRIIIEMCLVEQKTFNDALLAIDKEREHIRSRSLVNLPTSHIGGTVELIGTSIIGGLETILQASWSPFDALKAVKEYDIPFMGGVPTMYKIFLSLPDLDTYEPKLHLKVAILSGEKVSLELLEGIRDHLCENILIGYGSTEAGAEVTFTEIGDDFKRISEGYVGKALLGVEIVIADEKGKHLPPRKVGEVLVKGILTAKSYYKMPKENKAGYTPDGYCKTGDLGFLDEAGGLYISGRIKEIIRVGAFTVLPSEIEEVVKQNPKVSLCAALGAPDSIKGEVVWLVVSPQLGQKFEKKDEKEILEMCRNNLAKFKVPEKIIVYPLNPNDLPITRIGKVDRVRLKKELLPKPK